jgi:hypothetical protein
MVIASIVVLVLGTLLVPIVVTRMPADYFTRVREHHGVPMRDAGPLRIVVFWLRNAAGALLVLAGIAMLVLPGQGVLTILAGLSLSTFPGKRKIELRIVRTRLVHHAIDTLRARAGKEPLKLDDPPHAAPGPHATTRHAHSGPSDRF